MNGSINVVFRISDQDRHAIGGFYADEDVIEGRYKSIEFIIGICSIAAGFYYLDAVAVDLPRGCQLKIAIEDIQESAPVFINILGRIFIESGQIQIVADRLVGAPPPPPPPPPPSATPPKIGGELN